MTSEEKDTEIDIDWTALRPSERDTYQLFVCVAHVLVGIIVSVLSFTGDFVSWGLGTGTFLPVLLSLTGLVYLFPTGVNWYRDEFLPFVNRITVISERENERFLRFQRIYRFTVLVSGYLATEMCQIIWTQAIAIFSPLWENLSPTLDPSSGLFTGLVILFVILWFILMAFFELILRSVYSDVIHLLDLEMRMEEAIKKTDDDQESK